MAGKTMVLAKTLVLDEQGHVLVVRRSQHDEHFPGRWDLPGGELLYGEEPEHGARREVDEETGIQLGQLTLVAVSSTLMDRYIVRIIYTATVKRPQVKLSVEHEDYQWLPLADLAELDINDPYKEAAEKLVSGA